jgi:hypothetical protein
MWLESVVAEEIPVYFQGIEATNKEDAESKFVQEIRQNKSKFPITKNVTGHERNHLPAEQDVKKVLNDLQEEGIIKITPKVVTTWSVVIVDKDKFEEKENAIYRELDKI